MAHVKLVREQADLDDPHLVEGLPGVGLVGKIATDHLVEEFGMTHYADVYCDGLPQVGIYRADDQEVQAPVRLYVDEKRDLLALQGDVPVSPSSAEDFADCVTGWLDDADATPLYLSGRPAEKDGDPPDVFGVATGGAGDVLTAADVDLPKETGALSGPTGALVNCAVEYDLPVVALVVESDPRFPDPEAARILIDRGIGPVAGVDVDVSNLVDRAEEIRKQKEQLAQRMQEGDDESSKAQPLGMFQ